jgi:hypothetical protein
MRNFILEKAAILNIILNVQLMIVPISIEAPEEAILSSGE